MRPGLHGPSSSPVPGSAFVRGICLATILGLMVLATGCSSFSREWREAGRNQPAPGSIDGRWEGAWVSESNGHRGGLRAILTPDSGGAAYRARFRATYAGILSFGYTAMLTATNQPDGVHFQGQADLGRLAGGVYHYEGVATATNFFSTYRASKDHGRFELRRPAD